MDANEHLCVCGKNTSQEMCSECQEKYKPKDHSGCKICGLCIVCGDCKKYGCKGEVSKDG